MNERTNKTTTTPNDPMKTLAKMVTEFNDETKKHLTLRVINKSHLGELSDVSYFTVRDTSDLLCYLVVELCLDDISEIGSVTVTHSLLRTWNLMPNQCIGRPVKMTWCIKLTLMRLQNDPDYGLVPFWQWSIYRQDFGKEIIVRNGSNIDYGEAAKAAREELTKLIIADEKEVSVS